jgi:hypothetical protein
LHIHVDVLICAILGHFLAGDVVVQVGGGEGQADLLVAKGAGEDDFLVAGLVFDLVLLETVFFAIRTVISYLKGAILEVLLDVS